MPPRVLPRLPGGSVLTIGLTPVFAHHALYPDPRTSPAALTPSHAPALSIEDPRRPLAALPTPSIPTLVYPRPSLPPSLALPDLRGLSLDLALVSPNLTLGRLPGGLVQRLLPLASPSRPLDTFPRPPCRPLRLRLDMTASRPVVVTIPDPHPHRIWTSTAPRSGACPSCSAHGRGFDRLGARPVHAACRAPSESRAGATVGHCPSRGIALHSAYPFDPAGAPRLEPRCCASAPAGFCVLVPCFPEPHPADMTDASSPRGPNASPTNSSTSSTSPWMTCRDPRKPLSPATRLVQAREKAAARAQRARDKAKRASELDQPAIVQGLRSILKQRKVFEACACGTAKRSRAWRFASSPSSAKRCRSW